MGGAIFGPNVVVAEERARETVALLNDAAERVRFAWLDGGGPDAAAAEAGAAGAAPEGNVIPISGGRR